VIHKITIIALFSILFSTHALAETSEYSLEPVMVTTQRFTTPIDSAAVITTVIDADQIEKSASNNLASLLESEAGIHVTDLFGISGSQSSVDMGGFGASGNLNTLMLLNGRRLNDVDLSGANLAAIPLESIERIEIVQGTSAVLFGDNAVGGVINIVTKNGFNQQQSQLKLQQGSYRTLETTFNSQGSFDNKSYSVILNNSASNGYRDNSSFENSRIAAELAFDQGSWLFGTRIFGSKEDLQLPGALNEPDYERDPTMAGAGKLESSKENRYAVEAFAKGNHYAAEIALSDKHQEAFFYGKTSADLTTVSLTPRYSRHLNLQDIIAGLDLYRSDLESEALFDAAKNQGAATRESYAIYATDTFSFNKQTQLELGARYQQVNLDITNKNLLAHTEESNDSKDGLTAWDISVSHKHRYGARNYLRLASSFRFPVLDEVWDYYSGTIALLEPQTSRHFEIGSDYPINDSVTLKANFFRIKIKNEISYDAAQYANVNLESTQHDGVNLNVRWQAGQFYTLSTAYGYRNATFTFGANSGKQIPLIPHHKLSLNNQFDLKYGGILNLNVIYTGERYFGDDNANQGKQLPAYTKVDLGYIHNFGIWKARLSIFNVTNEKAADHGYYGSYATNPYFYYPLPERSIVVGLEGNF
jgi:iron complex outermembrane receptor protein